MNVQGTNSLCNATTLYTHAHMFVYTRMHLRLSVRYSSEYCNVCSTYMYSTKVHVCTPLINHKQ